MTTIAPVLRILTSLHAGGVLVARPRGVVHVHADRLTRTGAAVARDSRPFCGVRSRRLRVVATDADQISAALDGRRFCRSCTTRLPARLGRGPGDVVTREDWLAAFGDLTPTDLAIAAAWARTVDETWQVATAVQMLHGSMPAVARTSEQHVTRYLHQAVISRRNALERAARTPEEIATQRAQREAEVHNRRLVEKSRRRDAAIDRAGDKARRGHYLLPHEREALSSA